MLPSAIAPSATVEPAAISYRQFAPFALFALTLGAVWFVCCRHLSAEWSYNEQYNYGWFVPFFALYLFWLKWEDRPPQVAPAEAPNSKLQAPKQRGMIVGIIGIPLLLLLLPVRLIEVANPDWRLMSWTHAVAAVALTLLAIWWVGGKPWLKHFAFPVVFVLTAVPWITAIEGPIIQGLMPTVASIATETLSLFGIPAEVQGNLIRIGNGVVGVNEACSGVRSLQTSIMIGLLFGELKRLSVPRRLLLVAAAVGIAFVANCGRAFFLVWIAATQGVPQVERWHDMAGIAIVALVFLGCLGVTALLSRGQPPAQRGLRPGGRSEDRGGKPNSNLQFGSWKLEVPGAAIGATLVWLLLIEAGVESWYRAHERTLRPSALWTVHWPESAPEFHEVKIDERTRTILHHDEGRGATWRQGTDTGEMSAAAISNASCLLYFFRWHPGHNSALLANAHRPDICLPASGWRQIADQGVRQYAVTPKLAIPFRHFEFAYDAAGRVRFAHAFYCVWEDRVPEGRSAAEGMSGDPSAWTRSERIQAVLAGRRHLGQQVMEYLIVEPREIGAAEAENAFASAVRGLIAPGPAQM